MAEATLIENYGELTKEGDYRINNRGGIEIAFYSPSQQKKEILVTGIFPSYITQYTKSTMTRSVAQSYDINLPEVQKYMAVLNAVIADTNSSSKANTLRTPACQ